MVFSSWVLSRAVWLMTCLSLRVGQGMLIPVVLLMPSLSVFLHALGARVASTKCYTFSTCPATRAELRMKRWTHINSTVQVCNSVRDLGGHLNFGVALCGTTFNKRLQRAITMARALAFKPWGLASKQSLTHMLILPLA